MSARQQHMDKVASPSLDSDAAESNLYSMIEQMESYAKAASWDDVEAIAIRLRHAIVDLPASSRRDALLAVQRSINKVAASATTARQRVSAKLTDLSRGKAAKKAYELR